jgi:hypothetical protein
MFAIIHSEKLQRRYFSIVTDAGRDREPGSGDDHSSIRSPAGLIRGPGFQGAGIEQGYTRAPTVGDENLSIIGDRAGHAWKSRQRCDVPPGIVANHLDAVARGVRNEDAPALRIEGGVIEGAASGARYGDGSDRFQRHDATPFRPLEVLLFLSARFQAHLIFGLARWSGVIFHAGPLLVAAYLAARLFCSNRRIDARKTEQSEGCCGEDSHGYFPLL